MRKILVCQFFAVTIGDGEWHLYDIAKDPGEVMDLRTSLPELYQDMLREHAD